MAFAQYYELCNREDSAIIYAKLLLNKGKDIYNMYGFTQEERKFIDETLKRFERKSEWFMSYMKGENVKEC